MALPPWLDRLWFVAIACSAVIMSMVWVNLTEVVKICGFQRRATCAQMGIKVAAIHAW
jgi:hypothetical protein